MSDRTINFGSDDSEATYQIQDDDPAGGGDFVIKQDGFDIARYDPDIGEWVFDTNVFVDTLLGLGIEVDLINGADTQGAGSGQIMVSDGLGNLEFESGSVTINGNSINLGGSVTLDAADIDAVGDGDTVGRDIYVINNGASDPSAATDDDLIFEKE